MSTDDTENIKIKHRESVEKSFYLNVICDDSLQGIIALVVSSEYFKISFHSHIEY